MRTSSAFLTELGVASQATTSARQCTPECHHAANAVVDVKTPETVPAYVAVPLLAPAECCEEQELRSRSWSREL